MYSKELEALIDAVLVDGSLDESEKAVLARRAEKEGVDLAELEVYINSLLQKRQQEASKKRAAEEKEYVKAKKEALGRVCPNCGRPVPPMTAKCECGYEFTSGKVVSSVQILFEKLDNIQLTDAELEACKSIVDNKGHREVNSYRMNEQIEKKREDLIARFPVPNVKEDIIEFLAMALPNAQHKGGLWGYPMVRVLGIILAIIGEGVFFMNMWNNAETDNGMVGWILAYFFTIIGTIVAGGLADHDSIKWNKKARTWRAKFEQVLIKGRSMRGDMEFQQQLDYYENLLKKK